jgi:hypothetical protein
MLASAVMAGLDPAISGWKGAEAGFSVKPAGARHGEANTAAG